MKLSFFKKIICTIGIFVLTAGLMGCGSSKKETDNEEKTVLNTTGAKVNVAVLPGPTGISAVGLMEDNSIKHTANNYNFTIAASNDAVVAGLTNGEYDIAALATNVAASLYHKTDGDIQICAINTYGVLHILEKGNEINSMSDLKGKTIYATGQGANPEYIIEYLLTENGLTYTLGNEDPEADVNIEFLASDTLTAGAINGQYDIVMLPMPAVTNVTMNNTDMRVALDLTDEWNKVTYDENCTLTMGCMVVRKEFAEQNPNAVSIFLTEYNNSVNTVLNDPDHAAELCVTYGILGDVEVAKAAIPYCNLCCITGASEIKKVLRPYYIVLLQANSDVLSGALPDENFYFTR